jgi:hypothetical protein
VCAENRVRTVVGQPSAQLLLDVSPGVSAEFLGFFINTQKKKLSFS